MFVSFLVSGLVLPFFEFFFAVLKFYGIQFSHLAPNSVLMLAVFAHLCKMYLGISPNLHLFRYFYLLQASSSRGIVGSCGFFLHTDHEPYISLPLKRKWDGWVQRCYTAVDDLQDCVRWPESPVEA